LEITGLKFRLEMMSFILESPDSWIRNSYLETSTNPVVLSICIIGEIKKRKTVRRLPIIEPRVD
jgi:hypothetical protein